MDILGSIGFGAITGLIGPIITGFTNYKMMKEKNAHEIARLNAESVNMVAESKAEVEKVKAKVEGVIQEVEAEAFTASIQEGNKSIFNESYMKLLMKQKWTAWIGAVICFMFGVIDFLKGLARPAITYYLIGASTWITYLVYEILSTVASGGITVEWATGMFEKIVLTIIYLTVSCVSWWFGDRRVGKFIAKHL